MSEEKFRLTWEGSDYYTGHFNSQKDFESEKDADKFIKEYLITNSDVTLIKQLVKFIPVKDIFISRKCKIGKHDFKGNEGKGCEERRACRCSCHEKVKP